MNQHLRVNLFEHIDQLIHLLETDENSFYIELDLIHQLRDQLDQTYEQLKSLDG